jgi:hypothetical protein
MLRNLVMGVALVGALSACKPEINGETYYCGPERLCPPNLECQLGSLDSFAYNCVIPISAEPFLCPEVTLDREPDEAEEDGYALGTMQCGDQITSTNWGCYPLSRRYCAPSSRASGHRWDGAGD